MPSWPAYGQLYLYLRLYIEVTWCYEFAVSSIHSLLTNSQICALAMLSLLIAGN